MKPITLHPGSVVVGVALALLGIAVAGAQTPQVQSVIHLPPRVIEQHIVGIPDPNDMVVIRQEAGPYTVPAGKVFTLTGLGTGQGGGQCALTVNGVLMLSREANFGSPTQPYLTIIPVPPGFSARPGDVLDLTPSSGGRACGYLSDARP